MAGGDYRNKRHETAELRRRIVELRDLDWGFREIAAEVHRDVHTVWDHYQAAMREIPAAAVEEHQEKINRRLDEQLRRIDMQRALVTEVLMKRHVMISNGHVVSEFKGMGDDGKPIYGDPYIDDGPLLAASDRLRQLDDQEAKLLGLYPKQAISISRETSEVDAAVIGLIQRARERADSLEAQINGQAP